MKFLKLHLCAFKRECEGFAEGSEIVIATSCILTITKSAQGHAVLQLSDRNTPWTVFESFETVVAALSQ